MQKKDSSPVRGGIKSNCVNNMPLLQSFRKLSNPIYKHDAPTELKPIVLAFGQRLISMCGFAARNLDFDTTYRTSGKGKYRVSR